MTRHITLLFLQTFLLNSSIDAQTVKINDEGDKIIEYADGTWRYVEPGEDLPLSPVSVVNPEKESKKLNQKEQDAEFRARIQSIREKEKKQRRVELLQIEIRDMAQKRLNLETEFAVMKASDTPDPTAAEVLERRIIKVREEEKKKRTEIKEAEDEAIFYEELVNMSIKKRTKSLAKYNADKEEKEEKLAVTTTAEKTKLSATEGNLSTSRPKSAYVNYNPKKDVILNPPKYECNVAIDEVDEFTGKRRKTTASELLFSYTRDEIRPYYSDREHTTCHANVTAMGSCIYVFSLEIAIASRTAPQEYGGILSNATLMVVLLDGSTISMINSRTDRGKYDAVRDLHTFQVTIRYLQNK